MRRHGLAFWKVSNWMAWYCLFQREVIFAAGQPTSFQPRPAGLNLSGTLSLARHFQYFELTLGIVQSRNPTNSKANAVSKFCCQDDKKVYIGFHVNFWISIRWQGELICLKFFITKRLNSFLVLGNSFLQLTIELALATNSISKHFLGEIWKFVSSS